MLFKTGLESLEDFNRLLNGGLHYIHFLEPAGQGSILLENATVLGKRRRTNTFELPRTQARFEQVGSVQRTARGSARPNQGVNLIDEQHGMRLVLQGFQHALEALLKITPVLGSGE